MEIPKRPWAMLHGLWLILMLILIYVIYGEQHIMAYISCIFYDLCMVNIRQSWLIFSGRDDAPTR